MAKKMTKRDHFNALLAIAEVAENPELVQFINHEVELLDKKNASDKKPTKQQEANEELKEVILEVLADSEGMTVTEIQKADARLAETSNQRVSALLRQMLGSTVERFEEKHKAYFKAL